MDLRKYKKYLPAAVFILLSFFLIWQNIANSPWEKKEVLRSDADIYYTYLPATIINKDPFFEKKELAPTQRYRIWPSPIDRSAVKMSMGVAFMELPFFMIGHAFALSSSNYDALGFSAPYHFVVSLASVVYTLLGLLFLFLFLKTRFSPLSSLISILLIGLGTNLYYYTVYETGMSHPITFFLLSALLYLMHNWIKKKKRWKSFLIGIILGLIVLVRPVNILFLLPLLILFKNSENNWGNHLRILFLPISQTLTVVIGGVLIILPQLIFWKLQTGSFIFYSYNDEGFFWLNPHIWEGLFSFRKGWFIYTPMAFLALFGSYRLYKNHKSYFWALLLFLPLFLYVTFSWWSWWYGGSFGARTLIDILPFMALPLTALIAWILGHKLRMLILIVPAFLVYFNLFQSWQYHHNIIHYDSMTWEGYKAILFKHHNPDGIWGKLRVPDYENAVNYGVEKENPPIIPIDPVLPVYEESVQSMMEYIRNDETWMNNVKEKALKEDLNLDTLLRETAERALKDMEENK